MEKYALETLNERYVRMQRARKMKNGAPIGNRLKFPLTYKDVNGERVKGRVCSVCGNWKALDCFGKDKKTIDGHTQDCRECRRTRDRERVNNALDKYLETMLTEYKTGILGVDKLNREIITKQLNRLDKYGKRAGERIKYPITYAIHREKITLGRRCSTCKIWSPLSNIKRDSQSVFGYGNICKSCDSEESSDWAKENKEKHNRRAARWRELNYSKHLSVSRTSGKKYYYKNKDKVQERRKKWLDNGGDLVVKAINQNRRALENALPNTLTTDCVLYLTREGIANFGDSKNHLDHWIPLSTGHGGSYFENMVSLPETWNTSKGSKNPYEWALDTAKQDDPVFIKISTELAKRNGLTEREFKDFVYWCFENKRSIHDVERDRRYSIEIWRTETGMQFPLPKYTKTFDKAGEKA